MNPAPVLPLTTKPLLHYTAKMAIVILSKVIEAILTQVAQMAFQSQELVQQLELQLQVLVIPQLPTLSLALEEGRCSTGSSSVENLNNLPLAVQ